MSTKIYLGQVKTDFRPDFHCFARGCKLYITKHKWDCGWYWALGYIGNRNLHTHFDIAFLQSHEYPDEIFVRPRYTRKQWWEIRDLFTQAYALKDAAGIYVHGGHQTQSAFKFRDANKARVLNEDLENILGRVWEIFCNPIYSVPSDIDGVMV